MRLANQINQRLIALSLCILSFFSVICTSGYSIMSYEEYAATQRLHLYSFRIAHPNGHLFYFGGNHSYNKEDKQYQLLQGFWQEFLEATGGKNSVVIVEGNICPVKSTLEDVDTEGGLITFLAHQHSLPVERPEPSDGTRIHELLTHFSLEEIIYTLAAQGASQAHRAAKCRKNFSIEKYVEDYLKRYQRFFQIPLTLDTVESIHKSLFAKRFKLEDPTFFSTITNPALQGTVINEVCRKNSMFRDAHIVAYIHRLLTERKNVFVVFGSTHAVMQEKALRSLCPNLSPD